MFVYPLPLYTHADDLDKSFSHHPDEQMMYECIQGPIDLCSNIQRHFSEFDSETLRPSSDRSHESMIDAGFRTCQPPVIITCQDRSNSRKFIRWIVP